MGVGAAFDEDDAFLGVVDDALEEVVVQLHADGGDADGGGAFLRAVPRGAVVRGRLGEEVAGVGAGEVGVDEVDATSRLAEPVGDVAGAEDVDGVADVEPDGEEVDEVAEAVDGVVGAVAVGLAGDVLGAVAGGAVVHVVVDPPAPGLLGGDVVFVGVVDFSVAVVVGDDQLDLSCHVLSGNHVKNIWHGSFYRGMSSGTNSPVRSFSNRSSSF